VGLTPSFHDVGDAGDLRAEDEGQARVLDRFLVARRHHPGVRDNGDVGETVRFLERSDGVSGDASSRDDRSWSTQNHATWKYG
jgi:hypothetical protein